MMKKISVITVCLNSEKTLERCVTSVVNQPYENLEYIVIDGGSTDRTVEIIKEYENQISYWVSEPDGGIYDAMNKGIAASTGEIVAFLNSDDWYEDNIIHKINDAFQRNIEILCSDVWLHKKDGVVSTHCAEDSSLGKYRVPATYCHQGIFAHKNLFVKYGMFDLKYRICADYDWQLRLLEKRVHFEQTDEIYANFRYGGISSRDDFAEIRLKERKEIEYSYLKFLCEYTNKGEMEIAKGIEESYQLTLGMSRMRRLLEKQAFRVQDNLHSMLADIFDRDSYSVFGGGKWGRELIDLLKQADRDVICIWDNNSALWGKEYREVKIKNPDQIKECSSAIIVASKRDEDEIEQQLNRKGLKKGKDYLSYVEIKNIIANMLGRMEEVL